MALPVKTAATTAILLTSLMGGHSVAADLALNITLPKIDTAEYHRPYVAVWLEGDNRKVVRDIAVWYENKKADGEGKKWLKDLRQWWRISGRTQGEPDDAVTGATRPVGDHTINVPATAAALKDLPPGQYEVVVEASREKGGRELIRLPLAWPPTVAQHQATEGKHELGAVALHANP
ncbi:DUF2271 domain-containing protein [Pusillimonas minor]|uniref:DUF2271 domain-containing protein n=1 Tax=Pusillimonas minor TaxID=2697024 RepID=A0A842HMF0_9BURK|nr:DUF2271 domain-containing protein [Pusillimonas minor]MBC2769999.1 DUF2271 domain-containing protein [Pusillimonas minor]